jgi:glutathione S-transferase
MYKLYSRAGSGSLVVEAMLKIAGLMTESAAIVIHLADLHPECAMAPLPGSALRPSYLRWMLFMASQMYPDILRYYYPVRYSTDPEHAPAIQAQAWSHLDRDFAVLAEVLGDKPFLLGDRVLACDLYACMMISWAPDRDELFARFDNLARYYARAAALPSLAEVWAGNEM